MRRVSNTANAIKIISDNTRRDVSSRGNVFCASFEFLGVIYQILNNGEIQRYIGNGMYSPLKVSYGKAGEYPEVTIGGIRMKAYHIAMILKDEDFADTYISDTDYVVNHTVVSHIPGVISSGSRNGMPLREVSYHPDYIELITQGENVRHGLFIAEFGLYDTYVSAKDVDAIREEVTLEPVNTYFFMDFDYRERCIQNKLKVERWYRNKGVEKKIIFNF